MILRTLALGLLALLTGCQSPRVPIRAIVTPTAPAEESDSALIARFGFNQQEVGYALWDLEGGKWVAQERARQPFVPASTSKVLTAVAALKILGPAHTFKTELLWDGKLRDGVFTGDVSLRGAGDPLLLAAHLQSLAQALRAQGVREVRGRFVVDVSRFAPLREIEQGIDPDGTWNPGLSPLSVEFNRGVARWKKHPDGKANFWITPSLPLFETGLATEAPSGDSNFAFESASSSLEKWLISPDASEVGSENLPVRDATAYTAQLFRSFCAMSGIQIPSPEIGLARGKRVASHTSAPLIEQVRSLLEFSNNPMAELIAMAAAQKLNPAVRDFDAAAFTLLSWWKRELPHLEWQGAEFKKGSGLSALNQFTPEQMVRVLDHAYRMSFDGASFVSLLPSGGWTGTLAKRFTDPDASLRVWAKTGTLAYASALAGYVFSRSGKPLVFSLFVLDRPAMQKFHWMGGLATRADLAREREWLSRARGLQDALVRQWVSR